MKNLCLYATKHTISPIVKVQLLIECVFLTLIIIIKRKIFLIKTIPKSYSKQYNNSYDINEKNLQQKARRLSTWPFKNYY